MFQRVIGEVKERLEARQLRKDLLKEAGLRDAVLHEAEIDPSVPGDIKNDAA
jgi:hypothetical protein